MIKVALPKGRIAKKSLALFERLYGAGFAFDDRKLILEHRDFTFMLVRSQDVPTYVAHRAADVGIVGLDVIEEQQLEVIRLLNLQIGRCKVVVGSPCGKSLDFQKPQLKIATKMPNITRKYFANKALSIETLKLYGSIELAPLVGLSDAIVDIVETGSTMKQNNLKIDEVIMESSAYLIANTNSFYEKKEQILALYDNLKSTL
ncbi:ATP phosphoribosyltransferase [Helicobacter cinaedi]|uniref:ATP phosphoribosyltransferase n=1 Tax=Helicobacter cinaedi TaxID=213 RepID=A0A377JNC6_9HELI|nr:ATP phosphoribosyltransferase [Helicobacter cinaedi]STP09177.1 ATP phosphoribosyltransferase catalytic subunit [Helicobacter cinaedi]